MSATTPPPKPWEQQPEESPTAYRAALIFFGLGYSRTIESAWIAFSRERIATGALPGRKTSVSDRPSGSFYRWYTNFDWLNRASAFDSEKIRLERVARDKAEVAERADWARKITQQRKDGWEVGNALLVRAMQMLDWPMEEVTTTEVDPVTGNPVAVTKVPAKWTLRDAVIFIKAAAELHDAIARSIAPSLVPSEPEPATPSERASATGAPTVTSVLVRLSGVDADSAAQYAYEESRPGVAGPPPAPA